MRRARVSPLAHAGSACTGTLPRNTNFYWGTTPSRQEPNA
jgi:hypothetical protein